MFLGRKFHSQNSLQTILRWFDKKLSCKKNFCQNSYLVNLMGMIFAKPWESFHPKGRSPEGWNSSQGLAKIICLPIGDHAMLLLLSLLNENYHFATKRNHKSLHFILVSRKFFSSNWQKFFCSTVIFRQFDEIYCTP